MSAEIPVNPKTGRREMSAAQVLEREQLNRENIASRLAARAREQRASTNGHGPTESVRKPE